MEKKIAIMDKKMVIMEGERVLFSPKLKHYLQMKIVLPAGPQVYFRSCTLLEALADVVFAAGTCKERQSICQL